MTSITRCPIIAFKALDPNHEVLSDWIPHNNGDIIFLPEIKVHCYILRYLEPSRSAIGNFVREWPQTTRLDRHQAKWLSIWLDRQQQLIGFTRQYREICSDIDRFSYPNLPPTEDWENDPQEHMDHQNLAEFLKNSGGVDLIEHSPNAFGKAET